MFGLEVSRMWIEGVRFDWVRIGGGKILIKLKKKTFGYKLKFERNNLVQNSENI